MKKAIYPGSFDPPTLGHMDIISRSAKMVDRLIVAVACNPSKRSLLSLDERVELLTDLTKQFSNIEVTSFTGLLVDFATEKRADIIIRGFRAISDFEYELQLAQVNTMLKADIETIFLVSDKDYLFLSSSIVKEVASFGGDVSKMVPKLAEQALIKKMGGKRG